MLPPGHIAGGYTAGKLAAWLFPQLNTPEFLVLAAFFGFFPDLDFFLAFAKSKRMIIDSRFNHHKFATHAPVLYFLIFGICYLIFPDYRYIAVAFIIGTWSHLLIDTFASDGTAWLYPFNRRLFGKRLDPLNLTETGFIKHWLQFIKRYSQTSAFKFEIILILIALALLSIIN